MRTIYLLFCLQVLSVGAFFQFPARPGANVLVGTWRVAEFTDIDEQGKWRYWFGEHPLGYWVLDTTGRVHIQIMKVPPLKPIPESNWDAGTLPSPEHALAAYAAYDAYFGTYTLDTRNHVVTIHVEGSLQPDYTNTEQPRPFRLEGDRLVIGDDKTYRLVLQRVR